MCVHACVRVCGGCMCVCVCIMRCITVTLFIVLSLSPMCCNLSLFLSLFTVPNDDNHPPIIHGINIDSNEVSINISSACLIAVTTMRIFSWSDLIIMYYVMYGIIWLLLLCSLLCTVLCYVVYYVQYNIM